MGDSIRNISNKVGSLLEKPAKLTGAFVSGGGNAVGDELGSETVKNLSTKAGDAIEATAPLSIAGRGIKWVGGGLASSVDALTEPFKKTSETACEANGETVKGGGEKFGEFLGVGTGAVVGGALGTIVCPFLGTAAGAAVGAKVGEKVGGWVGSHFDTDTATQMASTEMAGSEYNMPTTAIYINMPGYSVPTTENAPVVVEQPPVDPAYAQTQTGTVYDAAGFNNNYYNNVYNYNTYNNYYGTGYDASAYSAANTQGASYSYDPASLAMGMTLGMQMANGGVYTNNSYMTPCMSAMYPTCNCGNTTGTTGTTETKSEGLLSKIGNFISEHKGLILGAAAVGAMIALPFLAPGLLASAGALAGAGVAAAGTALAGAGGVAGIAATAGAVAGTAAASAGAFLATPIGMTLGMTAINMLPMLLMSRGIM